MLVVILVLQIVIIILVVLAIIGHRKLTEKRVGIKCEPVVYYEDKLFSDKVVAGYRVQIFYDGIPIGEPTKKMVYQAKTVDREAVRAALELARQGLQKGLMKGFKLGDIQVPSLTGFYLNNRNKSGTKLSEA